ncbi:MAG: YeeE/YedE family protein [Marinibacterium sp.]
MIETWKEIVVESAPLYLAWGGLIIGTVFGYIVYRTNFCTMGSLSDILSFDDWNRFRAWILAIAVAVLGVWVIALLGIADMSLAMYLTPSLGWGANIAGGLLFGFGMVYAGGCVSRNLVREGGGDLRSIFVLLIIGLFAYMTIGGLIGPLRVLLFTPLTSDLSVSGMETQSLGAFLSGMTGMAIATATTVTTLGFAGLLLVFCFASGSFRTSGKNIAAGVGLGLCVVAGWVLTGLAYDEFADNPSLISLTYVRPVGDTMDYLMRFTAFGAPTFAVATVAGALLGAFIGALLAGRLNLTTFADKSDTLRNMFGAALMGVGGVLALGCTIGQGLTGISTLAVGSIIALLSIILGGVIGIKTMEAMA